METIAQMTALCVVAALLALVLRRGTPELGLLLTISVTVVVLLALADSMGEVLTFLTSLTEKSGVERSLFVPLYKTTGIAIVVNIGSCLCRDAGETALATVIETAGTLCALLAALPLLQAVLSLLLELMA